MSGGSMEYLCMKVDEAEFEQDTALRKLFKAHLTLVAKALHDIEWEDSGDYGSGDADKAIIKVLNFKAKAGIQDLLKEDIKQILKLVDTLTDTLIEEEA